MDYASLIVTVVVAGFATASFARLVTRETGLFGVFVKLRNCPPQGSTLWEILNCPLCLGWWACVGFTALTMLLLGVPALWFVLLAPSALGVAYAGLGLAAQIQ